MFIWWGLSKRNSRSLTAIHSLKWLVEAVLWVSWWVVTLCFVCWRQKIETGGREERIKTWRGCIWEVALPLAERPCSLSCKKGMDLEKTLFAAPDLLLWVSPSVGYAGIPFSQHYTWLFYLVHYHSSAMSVCPTWSKCLTMVQNERKCRR